MRSIRADELSGEDPVETVELGAEVIWTGIPDEMTIPNTTLKLMSGEEVVESIEIADGLSEVKFTPVAKFNDAGEEIHYSVSQDSLENFTTEIRGFVVENTYVEPVVIAEVAEEQVVEEPVEEPVEEEPVEEEPVVEAPIVEEPVVEEPVEEEPVVEEPVEEKIEEVVVETEGVDDSEYNMPWRNITYKNTSLKMVPVEESFSRMMMSTNLLYTNDGSGTYPNPFIQGMNLRNPDPIRKEIEEGFITKVASNTGINGEFFIDLKIEGKQITNTETVDVVLVLDNSGSMGEWSGNKRRREYADEAARALIDGLLTGTNTIRMALVTYSTNLINGNSVYNFTSNADALKNKLPNGYGGVTFTQEALLKAGEIIGTSTASKKYIVLISDGVPTKSYRATSIVATTSSSVPRLIDYNGVNNPDYRATAFGGVVGDSGYYDLRNNTDYLVGGYRVTEHGFATMSQGLLLKSGAGAPTVYTVGIELDDQYGATQEEAFNAMKNIASGENNYFNAAQASQLVGILEEIQTSIQNKINNGVVTDPMSSMVNLNRGADGILNASDFTLTASDNALLSTVTVTENPAGTIKLSGLNLGAGEYVNLRYKINLKTEDPGFVPGQYYLTNERTFLTPVLNGPEREFGIPAVNGVGVSVEGSKNWVGDAEEDRPDSIKINLYRASSTVAKTKIKDVTLLKTDFTNSNSWTYSFNNLAKYDNLGNNFTYTVEEELVPGYSSSVDGYVISNTLKVGSLTIKKVKDDGITTIDTAKFELLKDGETTPAVQSTSGGIATFTNLKPGTYTLTESEAPEGYALSSDAYQVIVSLNDSNNIVVTVKNGGETIASDPLAIKNEALGSVEIKKTDSITGGLLQGAEFDLYKEVPQGTTGAVMFTMLDGTMIYGIKINAASLVTGVNGLTPKVENLLLGNYFVVETKSPTGYNILEEPVRIVLTAENVTIQQEIKNISSPMIPMTGGVGTMIFSIIGLALMGGALLGYNKFNNKNSRRGELL